jgi:hypothetical protein
MGAMGANFVWKRQSRDKFLHEEMRNACFKKDKKRETNIIHSKTKSLGANTLLLIAFYLSVLYV